MQGGRERNILRWDLRTRLVSARLERVEADLAALGEPDGPKTRARQERLLAERIDLMGKLRALGPSPTARMG
jgi:hypothetical protein